MRIKDLCKNSMRSLRIALVFMLMLPFVLQGDGEELVDDDFLDFSLKDKVFFEKAVKELMKESEVAEPYRLNVGDTLKIGLYGEHNTERIVTIDNHGGISYLLIGRLQAVGKTIDELRKEINSKIRERFRYVLATVVPVNFGGRYFTILGQVDRPGKKPIEGKTTLLQALGAGGGFRMGAFRHGSVDLADLSHSFLARNGEYVSADIRALVVDGDMAQNVEIEDGDYIFVPSALRRMIYVLGEVKLPANVGYLDHQTLLGVIAKARGVTSKASKFAYIIRGSLSKPQRIEVNYQDMLHGKIPNVLLQPGDIVYVPPRNMLFMEEIVKAAIGSFVISSTYTAGEETFEEIHPHAEGGDDSDGPVFIP